MGDSLSIILADTSVLINFLAIDRMDLLQQYSGRFLITDHVRHEVTRHYPDQWARLLEALEQGILEEIQVTDPDEVETFAHWTGLQRFGKGECACIAVALHRGYAVAMDDRRAIHHALRACDRLEILTTLDLMLTLIQENLLTLEEADAIKNEWASCHRFQLKIASFRELL